MNAHYKLDHEFKGIHLGGQLYVEGKWWFDMNYALSNFFYYILKYGLFVN